MKVLAQVRNIETDKNHWHPWQLTCAFSSSWCYQWTHVGLTTLIICKFKELPWVPIYGPSYANLFLGKLEHEFLGTQNKLTSSVMEVYRWQFCNMDSWWTNFRYLHRKYQLSPPFHQIDYMLVSQRTHFSGHKSLRKGRLNFNGSTCQTLWRGTNSSA